MDAPHVALEVALVAEDLLTEGAGGLAAVQRQVVPIGGGRTELPAAQLAQQFWNRARMVSDAALESHVTEIGICMTSIHTRFKSYRRQVI